MSENKNMKTTKIKTKRTKKRFLTANQIRDEIDAYKLKYQKFTDQAAALDMKADEMARQGFDSESINWNREQAKRVRATAARIKEVRLVKLKEKLAEWMTPQLPGLDNGDRSVQA